MKPEHIRRVHRNGKLYEYFDISIPFTSKFTQGCIKTLERMARVCDMKLGEYVKDMLIEHVRKFAEELLEEKK